MHLFAKIFFLGFFAYLLFLVLCYNSVVELRRSSLDAKADQMKEFFTKSADNDFDTPLDHDATGDDRVYPIGPLEGLNKQTDHTHLRTDTPSGEPKLQAPEQKTAPAPKVQAPVPRVPLSNKSATKALNDFSGLSRGANPFYILGAYPDVDIASARYNIAYRGHLSDNSYCEKVDMYNLVNPDNLFKNKNFYSDFPRNHLPRAQVMDRIGKISMDVYNLTAMRGIKKYPFHQDINAFHMDSSILHLYQKIGSNFLCATQMYNHIPGITSLIAKDKVVDSVKNYIKKYEDNPQCFNETSLFPRTYRLYDEAECRQFFEVINSDAYLKSLEENSIQYVIKVGFGVHKSEGVFLLDADQTIKTKAQYENGAKCGRENTSLIAQTYVNNPLLLNLNNKFDFRIYMLIASTNPFIVYYHDGFLRVSLNEYTKSSTDRATHLTNTYLANLKIQEAKNSKKTINGMTEKELQEYILWNYERFQTYLLESGKISDPNWLDNYLRPAFQRALVHLIRMSGHSFWKQSNVYALHGVDFMLDDQMNLWFIESNPSPLLTGTTKAYIYYDVLTSMFDIQFKYYRSRMKRVLDVINRMQLEVASNKPVDYSKWRLEYQEASKNRLEPEYSLNKNNTYTLVMDENLPGEKAYFGHISAECAY